MHHHSTVEATPSLHTNYPAMRAKGQLYVDDMTFEVIPLTGPTTDKIAMPLRFSDSTTVVGIYAKSAASPVNLDFESR